MTRTLEQLTPTEFENFTFDLAQSMGMQPLVWRTPGSDGGRDIEGFYAQMDASGYVENQKWYIECKRYNNSIDWPTIRGKLAYAENHKANFLLLVTNSNPSPQCETEISTWNASFHPLKIRVWRGYDLSRILQSYPAIASKYALTDRLAVPDATLLELMKQALGIAQSTHATFEFGGDPGPGLEASSSLAEMIALQVEQLASHGRVALAEHPVTVSPFPWLDWPEGPVEWDDAGLRALIACYRYCLSARRLTANYADGALHVRADDPKLMLSISASTLIREIAVWANIQIVSAAIDSAEITIQPAQRG